MRTVSFRFGVPLVMIACGLAGCGSSQQEELQQWMNDQRNAIKPKIDPIAEPTRFSPEAYKQEGLIEPFSNQKLTQALKRESNQASANVALITPELNRRKEPLEALPLDTMSMIGSINKAGSFVALVRADNLTYQVRVGNYLGQNYGRVMAITENSLTLREIVQDATGEWTERPASLQLTEVSK